jgi:hypothetical protein
MTVTRAHDMVTKREMMSHGVVIRPCSYVTLVDVFVAMEPLCVDTRRRDQ